MPSLPPPHPSLPRPPHAYAQYNQSQRNIALPLAQPSYHNSHYAQAYNQYASSTSTISTNVPIASSQNYTAQRPSSASSLNSTWYQPGNHRCSQQDCSFTGSARSVEIHMMDRHLIYPPGWEKRKKKQDWDADPSLKGKPIPIQGTNIILDSPEVLQAWIEERKKRFPTSSKVEEKKRKLEQASARGQLDLSDIGLRHPKRRKVEQRDSRQTVRPNRGRAYQQPQSHAPTQPRVVAPDQLPNTSKSPIPQQIPLHFSEGSDDDDESDTPEIISSKGPEPEVMEDFAVTNEVAPALNNTSKHQPVKQILPIRPKNPLRNPFASRPTLLRNLLAPEIRITVSNLSQAIRFLIDNDLLRNVELKPGEATEKNKIQVLASSSAIENPKTVD